MAGYSTYMFDLMQSLRVAGTVALALPIPLAARLLLLYAMDLLDCDVPKLLYAVTGGSNPVPCSSFQYQWNDKLVDTLVYVAVLAFLFLRYPHVANVVLLAMLLYRAVGVAKFGATQDPHALVQHPDMFREFSLVVAAVHDGWLPASTPLLAAAALVIAVGKRQFEYLMHVAKNNDTRYT